jgi:hypothetical protein
VCEAPQSPLRRGETARHKPLFRFAPCDLGGGEGAAGKGGALSQMRSDQFLRKLDDRGHVGEADLLPSGVRG